MSKSLFLDFMDKLLTFPLWIKQTVYLNLSKDLNNYLSNEFLDVEEDELFHLYRPSLSEMGQNELLTKDSKFDDVIYSFMSSCSKNMTLRSARSRYTETPFTPTRRSPRNLTTIFTTPYCSRKNWASTPS